VNPLKVRVGSEPLHFEMSYIIGGIKRRFEHLQKTAPKFTGVIEFPLNSIVRAKFSPLYTKQ